MQLHNRLPFIVKFRLENVNPNSFILDFTVGQRAVKTLSFFVGGNQPDQGGDSLLLELCPQSLHQFLGNTLMLVAF